MLELEKYSTDEKIYESYKTIVYKGQTADGTQTVALKTLRNPYPSREESTRLQKEFEMLQSLSIQKATKTPDFARSGNRPVLVMEFIEGNTLQQFVEHNKLTPLDFISRALQITHSVEQVHLSNIIHKDINLENFLHETKTDEIRLIDFDISTKFLSESIETLNHKELEGNLRYISPEQTGRMNRSIDYRTDFYSLGICFYKMITGKYPFESDEPLALIHSHLAQIPIAPIELDPTIPPAISRIIMMLLEKSADNRYQSIKGLIHDLNECKKQLEEGNLTDFEIAGQDFQNKFKIPEKLYGREAEVSKLLESYEESASGKKNMVLVTGPPGIGKTVLINEIHKPIIEKKGYFCSGKFEQYQKNVPFFAIIQAFGMLIKQLLTEGENIIAQWKNRVLENVGKNGQVVIDVIPEVELLIGKQPEVEQLPPTETQNRFYSVFQDFIEVFPRQEHPLVIFIDDLQWADRASLGLIKTILTNKDSGFLLFIGAFRDTEIDNTHILKTMLNDIKTKGETWKNLSLSPLKEQNILEMARATLLEKAPDPTKLVSLIHNKTGGNPFFVKEFFKFLYEESYIQSVQSNDENNFFWHWDIGNINEIGITNNVVELMEKKIRNLNEAALSILKTACCIGTKFSIEIVSAYYNKTKYDIYKVAQEAINTGIIIKIKDGLKFAHDKVTETAYNLIPEKEASHIHYGIGKVLLHQAGEDKEKLDELLFSIAEQLNKTKDQLTDGEKDQLRKINFEAGVKAKLSVAYEGAVDFFENAADLLPDDAWETKYEETFKLYIELAESEDLSMNFDKSEKIYNMLLENVTNDLDKASVYQLMIVSLATQSRYEESYRVCRDGLRILGLELPEDVDEELNRIEIDKTKKLLYNKTITQLSNLPEIQDEKLIKAIDMLYGFVSTAVVNYPMLGLWVFSKVTNLTLEYGITKTAPPAIVSQAGTVFIGLFGDYETGYLLGEMGIKIAERGDTPLLIEGNTKAVAKWCITHLKEHHKDVALNLRDDVSTMREVGNWEIIGYIIFFCYTLYPTSGMEIGTIIKKMEDDRAFIEKLPFLKFFYPVVYQALSNLMQSTHISIDLDNKMCDEKTAFEQLHPLGKSATYTIKLLLAYLFDEDDLTEYISKGEEFFAPFMEGLPQGPLFRFFQTLSFLRLYPAMTDEDKKAHLATIEKMLERFKKMGDFNQHMFQHKYLLLLAEYKRIQKEHIEKIGPLYDEAVEIAAKSELPNDQGLINELAGDYYFSMGMKKVAEVYLAEAHYCYTLWGASAKAVQLDKKYHMLNLAEKMKKGHNMTVSSPTTVVSVENLNLMSILKASQTLSGEVVLKQLLEKLMDILIENAGAQRGVLLENIDGQLFIQADASSEGDSVILQRIPYEDSNDIPTSLINYAVRSKTNMNFANISRDKDYAMDRYIQKHQTKSVVCFPFQKKGNLVCIVYLENNLMEGAFTQEHLDVLNLLSSQIAVSIENAELYENLEEKVAKRTQELKKTLLELEFQHKKLKETQSQLVQSEKMAGLGTLVAGIAHEINNPANFVRMGVDNLDADLKEFKELLLNLIEDTDEEIVRDFEDKFDRFFKSLENVNEGSSRIKTIVDDLRSFSRLDEANQKKAKVGEGLSSTLRLIKTQYSGQVEFVCDSTVDPEIEMYPARLNQVFMNLMTNACHAIEKKQAQNNDSSKGKLTIRTFVQENYLGIQFWDTGCGMTDEEKRKIFEPFFSTKEVGHGTGLGMSVSFGIIEKHNGRIEIDSTLGEGSVITLFLPLN